MSLKRNLTFEDIIIYDKEIEFSNDERRAGYNIGNLLNMPYLSGQWKQCPHVDEGSLQRMNVVADICKDSILHFYCQERPSDEKVPYIPRVIDSVEKYIEKNRSVLESNDVFQMIQNPNCLCIHIRSGDLNVEEEFVNIIEQMSHNYEKVILLGGIHLDEYFKPHYMKTIDLVNQMNYITSKNSNIFVSLEKPDVHLSMMHKAANLMVHKGGFSCLGSILSTGKLFVTPHFEFANHPNWIENVEQKRYFLVRVGGHTSPLRPPPC